MPKRIDIDRTTPGFLWGCACEEHGVDNRDGTLTCSECHTICDYKFPCGVNLQQVKLLSDSRIMDLARVDTAFFGWYFLPHYIRIENGIPLIHQAFYKKYDTQGLKRIAIIAPRKGAKTTIVVNVIGTKETLYQNIRFAAIVSEESSLAILHITSMKMEYEDNPIIRRMFGTIVPRRAFGRGSTFKWKESDFITTTGVRWFARGMDQRTRGGKHRNARYHLLIIEDPESNNNTRNAESIRANQNWLSKEILPALDEKIGRAIFAANTVCVGCIAETIKASTKWDTVFERMEPEGEGSSYWHLRFPLEDIKDLRDEYTERDDFETFETEFNNNPNPDITKELNCNNLRFWKGVKYSEGESSTMSLAYLGAIDWETGRVKYEEVDRIPFPVDFCIGLDPAGSENDRSDFSCVTVGATDSIFRIFVVESERFKTKQMDVIAQRTFGHIKRYNPRYCVVEENNIGKAVIQILNKMIHEHNIKNIAKYRLRTCVISVTNTMPKQERIKIGLQSPLNAGKLYVDQILHKDLRAEMAGFPRLVHDDCVDSLEICLSKLRPAVYENSFDAMRGIYRNRKKRRLTPITDKARWLTL